MKMDSTGFTLIEIIAIIVIGSIVAAMFIPFFSTALTRSSEAVNIIKESFQINEVVADLTADYRNKKQSGTLNLQTFYASLSTFEKNDVTVSGKYLNFRNAGGSLNDADSDGIFDPLESAAATAILMVTAEKNTQTMSVIFTE